MVAQVKPIRSQNCFAGTRKCTIQSDARVRPTRIGKFNTSLHSPHPHGVWPLASLSRMAEMPKISHTQLAKYVFEPDSAVWFVGKAEKGCAIQMAELPGASAT